MLSQHKLPSNSIRSDLGLKSGFLDSDRDVCLISPKMLWIRYIVGVSHFTECRENRPASDCVRNANKSPIRPWWVEWKSDLDPYLVPDYDQLLTSSSNWQAQSQHQVSMESGNWSITFGHWQNKQLAERQINCTDCITSNLAEAIPYHTIPYHAIRTVVV